jgi:hypothetical protein
LKLQFPFCSLVPLKTDATISHKKISNKPRTTKGTGVSEPYHFTHEHNRKQQQHQQKYVG